MGILASGAIIAKFIGFASIPVITRLYSPEDFGIFSVFTSAVAILVPVMSLKYSIVIPLPKQDGMAVNIAAMILGFIAGFALLFSGLFFFFGDAIFSMLNMDKIADYWYLLVFSVTAAAVYEILKEWGTRRKNFKPVAQTQVWQTLSSTFVKIVLGFIGLKPIGLLIGNVAKNSTGIISLLRTFFDDFRNNIVFLSRKRISFLFRFYADIPIYRLPSQILLVIATKAPILFFAYQFGQDSTGQLGLALMVIATPMNLIGTSTGKAYFGEISRIGNKHKTEIRKVTKNVVKRLFLLSLAPCLLLLFFAPALYSILFGSEWETAGVFTSILAVYLLFQFITTPLVNVFTVFNRQRKFLEINIVRSMLILLAFGSALYLDLTTYQTLILYTALISAHYIFTGYQVFRVIK